MKILKRMGSWIVFILLYMAFALISMLFNSLIRMFIDVIKPAPFIIRIILTYLSYGLILGLLIGPAKFGAIKALELSDRIYNSPHNVRYYTWIGITVSDIIYRLITHHSMRGVVFNVLFAFFLVMECSKKHYKAQ